MGVWRMEIDMSFATKAEMNSMLNLIEAMRDKLQKKVDPELPIPCKVRTHECMHNEDPPLPCSGYIITEFDGLRDHGIPAENVVPNVVKTAIKAPLEADKAALIIERDALQAENDELKKPTPTGPTALTGPTGA